MTVVMEVHQEQYQILDCKHGGTFKVYNYPHTETEVSVGERVKRMFRCLGPKRGLLISARVPSLYIFHALKIPR